MTVGCRPRWARARAGLVRDVDVLQASPDAEAEVVALLGADNWRQVIVGAASMLVDPAFEAHARAELLAANVSSPRWAKPLASIAAAS